MEVIKKYRAYFFIFLVVWLISFLSQVLHFKDLNQLIIRPLIAGIMGSSLVAVLLFIVKALLPDMYAAFFPPVSTSPHSVPTSSSAPEKGQKLYVTLSDDEQDEDFESSFRSPSGGGRIADPSADQMMSSSYTPKPPSQAAQAVFEQEPQALAKAVRSVMNKE